MIEVCAECGIPLMVSEELSWGDNGVIYSSSSPKARWVFYESGNIDPLFRGIEELIGVPIEHIVIESRRRETQRYIERNIPQEIRSQFQAGGDPGVAPGMPAASEEMETKNASLKAITDSIFDISRIHGYGDQSTGELWESGEDYPWRTEYIRNPFSLPLTTADVLGSVEAFEGTAMWAKYEEVGPDRYKITTYPGEHPVELRERLARKLYDLKPGDINYECCPQCGLPEAICRYSWDLDEGTITDPDTGRRMAIFGPFSLDSIFDDLGAELGRSIEDAIIEAERKYIRKAWGDEEWNRDVATFRELIALRGLGNLVKFEGGRNHLSVTIENSCLRFLMVGIIQALVEMVYGRESSAREWHFSDEGDLNVTVKL
ncbi:MAG: hypothetical protein ACOC78_00425 [Actinomycetota bacterium]